MTKQPNTTRQQSFTKDDLLKCGRGEMFGEGNAQLPLPPMLMFDRIVKITEDGGKYGNGWQWQLCIALAKHLAPAAF